MRICIGKHVNGFNQSFEQLWTKWQERGDLLWHRTHLLRHFFMPPARFKIGFVKNCRVDADRFKALQQICSARNKKHVSFCFLLPQIVNDVSLPNLITRKQLQQQGRKKWKLQKERTQILIPIAQCKMSNSKGS